MPLVQMWAKFHDRWYVMWSRNHFGWRNGCIYPYRYILDLETKFLVNVSISDIVSYYWTSLKIIRTLKKYIYNLISVFICSILYLSENNFFVYFYFFSFYDDEPVSSAHMDLSTLTGFLSPSQMSSVWNAERFEEGNLKGTAQIRSSADNLCPR